jgi:type II secretory pathway component PulC
MKKIKITALILIIILGFFIPYVYSTISGNYAVSFVDPTNPLKYYTMVGDLTSGLWVNIKNTSGILVTQGTSPWVVGGTVSTTQGTSPWVISGTVAVSSLPTITVVGSKSTTFSHNQVLVSNSATLIKASNTNRYSLIIRNQGSVDEYVGDSGVTTGSGMLLHPNDAIIVDNNTAAWYGITSSGTTTTSWMEE